MVQRRVYVNLGAFLLLFAVLAFWAVTNVVRPDFLHDSYQVRADFSEASGLRPGVEVTLLGVRIGHVKDVAARPGRAEVVLSIDRGVRLPVGSGAAVRRRSAVGEPYVAINPPPGWTRQDAAMPVQGAQIPLSATTTPVAYGDLFTSAEQLLRAVNPADVATISHELAVALKDKGPELAAMISNSSEAATTLAAGQAELRQLGQGLTTLTSTLSDKSATLARSTQDLSAIVQLVSSDAGALNDLLDKAPLVSQQIDALLGTSYAQLVCGADATAGISNVLGNDKTVAQIVELLRAARTASVVIPKAVYQGPDGRYLSGTFGLAPGATNAYPTFPTFASPPPMPTCEGTSPTIGPVPQSSVAPSGRADAGAPKMDSDSNHDTGEASSPSSRNAPNPDAHRRESPSAPLLVGSVALFTCLFILARRYTRRRGAALPGKTTGAS